MVNHFTLSTEQGQAEHKVEDAQTDHEQGSEIKFLTDTKEWIADYIGCEHNVQCKSECQRANDDVDETGCR